MRLAEPDSAVDAVWDFLVAVESQADVTHERRKPKVSSALEGVKDADVWKEVQRRRAGAPVAASGICDAEVEALMSGEEIVSGQGRVRLLRACRDRGRG